MKITVLSEQWAVDYQPAARQKAILIRIGDPNFAFRDLRYAAQYLDILSLQFHDVEEEWTLASYIQPFTASLAQQIVGFVKGYAKELDEIVIHCYAGMSRSVGVAYGLCALFKDHQRAKDLLENPRYHLNLTCARYVLAEIGKPKAYTDPLKVLAKTRETDRSVSEPFVWE